MTLLLFKRDFPGRLLYFAFATSIAGKIKKLAEEVSFTGTFANRIKPADANESA